jgi:hypothetical protein
LRLLPLILVLICCQFASAQTSDSSSIHGVESVFLAKDDGSGKAGEPVTEFKITDIPIYCVVLLDSKGVSVVKMVFVAMDVAGVKPETKVVTSAYTTNEGQNRVNFTGRPYGKWIPGKYRVDIFINDTLATDVEFLIRPHSKPVVPRAGRSTASKRSKPRGGPANP